MFRRRIFQLETQRMVLRPPQMSDYRAWVGLRQTSKAFLTPWDPAWKADHLSKKNFSDRVYWAKRAMEGGTAFPLFLIHKTDHALMGAITLDNIRRGPMQSGTLGYWIGQPFARQGFMHEACQAVIAHSFDTLHLSRLEAACLKKNIPSCKLLEKVGFKYEGVAQSYMQINGHWHNHVLYACLRSDRRGKVE